MTRETFLTALIFGCAISSALSTCASNVQGKTDFNINNYLGKWYYFMHSEAAFIRDQCSYSEYSLIGSTINIKKTAFNNGNKVERSGTAVPQSGNPGNMEVSFGPGGGSLKVIDTDYTDYSLIWTCIQPRPGVPSKNIAWIFSRRPAGPNASTIRRLKAHLSANYNVHNLIEVNQSC